MRVNVVISKYGLDDIFPWYASTGIETIVIVNEES